MPSRQPHTVGVTQSFERAGRCPTNPWENTWYFLRNGPFAKSFPLGLSHLAFTK